MKVATMVENHLAGILTHWQWGVPHAFMEGRNSVFSASKRRARGYRSTTHRITMLYFVAGKLRYGRGCRSSAGLAVSFDVNIRALFHELLRLFFHAAFEGFILARASRGTEFHVPSCRFRVGGGTLQPDLITGDSGARRMSLAVLNGHDDGDGLARARHDFGFGKGRLHERKFITFQGLA
ncbi:MAG: transposase [Verrucomicrobiae bacterium]|nr:transposase [Verrucomicrobiae bacterium]